MYSIDPLELSDLAHYFPNIKAINERINKDHISNADFGDDKTVVGIITMMNIMICFYAYYSIHYSHFQCL